MIICKNINIVYLHESSSLCECLCVCVCVLMTSSWSAKSLHVEGHSFRSPPLGVMNFKRNLEGERNLQLETAGQFSWAVSSPPPKRNGSCGHWRLFANLVGVELDQITFWPGIGEKEQYGITTGITIHDTLPLWEAADMPVETSSVSKVHVSEVARCVLWMTFEMRF